MHTHTASPTDAPTLAAETTEPLELSWSKEATPLEAIERALYALADQLSGTVAGEGDLWAVRIHPRSATAHPDVLAHQLRQSVTDQTLRVRIAERTDPLRNLIFALAFSRSGLGAEAAGDSSEDAGT